MESFLLTDWTTISADGGVGVENVTSVPHSASEWLDLGAFEDATFTLDVREVATSFLEVREIQLGGATKVTVTYQTAPTKDASLFVNMTTAVTAATGRTVTLMPQQSVTNPLSRWVRFQLGRTGSPGSAWGLTFRVWLAANASAANRSSLSPAMRERMVPATPSSPMVGRAAGMPGMRGMPGVRGMPAGAILPAGRNSFTG
jgi:hypothetical protein